MLHTKRGFRGMVTAPHHLAAQAGRDVLREGGNAIEAMIAAAATIAVTYPHMNGLGGDGFWLICRRGEKPVGIRACGRSARLASRDWYRDAGVDAIPSRGPLAALTVAGAVSGWRAAFELSRDGHGGRLPMELLLQEAIRHARHGAAVTRTLHDNASRKLSELGEVPGFAETYLKDGAPPGIGACLRQARVADVLESLSQAGLQDFYAGDVARSMASELEAAGSPLRLADLEAHEAAIVAPLTARIAGHDIYNLPPPTQGLASLLILALNERLPASGADGADYVHKLVECSKAAFRVRDTHLADPDFMDKSPDEFLSQPVVAGMSAEISMSRAAPWPHPAQKGDTVWLGAADSDGLVVSYIQSIYWEFGSGLVLPTTGITWQNRGTSFSLDPDHRNRLDPGRLPFQTIQPALACLSDGRILAYGTMGGEGQPQTQAAVFTRHVLHGYGLQDAITAPRWLLGRTWGEAATNLKLEARFDPAVIDDLRARGHDVAVVDDFDEIMGHAGAVVHHPGGLIEGASDPRSDGAAASL